MGVRLIQRTLLCLSLAALNARGAETETNPPFAAEAPPVPLVTNVVAQRTVRDTIQTLLEVTPAAESTELTSPAAGTNWAAAVARARLSGAMLITNLCAGFVPGSLAETIAAAFHTNGLSPRMWERSHLPPGWPAEPPEFRERALALYGELDRLGRRILGIIARSLGLEADWFEPHVDRGNSILRAIHYPPIDNGETPAVRAARHEDINLITLLIGSNKAGLEILARDGGWVPVTSIPGTIVVNIGDMMKRLTNDVLPSTPHRVVNPAGAAAQQPRYSIPFFLHPNPDFVIRTLPECIGPERPDRYPEPLSADEFLKLRLRENRML